MRAFRTQKPKDLKGRTIVGVHVPLKIGPSPIQKGGKCTPVRYTTIEGGDWHSWTYGCIWINAIERKRKAHVAWEKNKPLASMRIATESKVFITLHAIELEDGSQWDTINGWRWNTVPRRTKAIPGAQKKLHSAQIRNWELMRLRGAIDCLQTLNANPMYLEMIQEEAERTINLRHIERKAKAEDKEVCMSPYCECAENQCAEGKVDARGYGYVPNQN